MNLEDFDAEIVARGFDGFDPGHRIRYINWGYFHVARASRWYWEKTTLSFTLNPGEFKFDLPATFKSLVALVKTTAGQQMRVTTTTQEDFLDNWYSLDLTLTDHQGEPDQYFEWDSSLYILPPPSAARGFSANIYQRVVELGSGDTPITPPDQDEAILLSALIRCHTRANQIDLARDSRMQLEEQFDIALTEDEFRSGEELERTQPDQGWAGWI